MRTSRYRYALVAVSTTALLAFPSPTFAPTIVVDNENCTLVDAITAANTDSPVGGCPAGSGADTIKLSVDVLLTTRDHFSYGHDNGLPLVESDITIAGGGFAIERDANAPFFRLMAVAPDGVLSVHDTTLLNGDGGIHNRGSVSVTDSALLDNYLGSTAENGGGYGIRSPWGGVTSVTNTTVSGNWWGIRTHGGIVTVNDSFLSDNHAGMRASDSLTYVENTVIANNASTGLYITGRVGGPFKYVTNTTISGNGGSGLYVYYYDYTLITNTSIWGNSGFGFESYAESQSFLKNTIIGGNLAGNCYNSYYLLDLGGNFTDDDTCLPGFDPITGFDPVLSDNGGSTLTHALLPGSPALDAGVNCNVAEDQRGYPRDVTCDAGSYELFCSLTVTRGSPDTLIDFTPASSPFDLVSGLLSELREDAGFARATCLGSFGTGPAVDPLPDPPTGDGRYYLARGVTSCPTAGFGVSTLTPDPRGALAAGPCP